MPAAAVVPLPPPPAPAALVGGRWAALLGSVLLVGFTGLTVRLWVSSDDVRETVVQQPVGPAESSTARPALTAPDPGDDL